MAADLLIERVQKLLPCRCTGERRAVIQSAAEAPVIQQSLRRTIERDAHAVEQIDDARRRFAHALDQRLIRQKIAAVNGVVKVLLRSVAFALLVFRRVYAALRAHRMRPLYRHDRKKLNGHACFRHANGSHQAGETSTHDNNFRLSHFEVTYESNGCQFNRKLRMMSTPTTLKITPTRTPSCPAARCARTVAASPHLQRKFQIPTPR